MKCSLIFSLPLIALFVCSSVSALTIRHYDTYVANLDEQYLAFEIVGHHEEYRDLIITVRLIGKDGNDLQYLGKTPGATELGPVTIEKNEIGMEWVPYVKVVHLQFKGDYLDLNEAIERIEVTGARYKNSGGDIQYLPLDKIKVGTFQPISTVVKTSPDITYLTVDKQMWLYRGTIVRDYPLVHLELGANISEETRKKNPLFSNAKSDRTSFTIDCDKKTVRRNSVVAFTEKNALGNVWFSYNQPSTEETIKDKLFERLYKSFCPRE